MAPVIIAAIMGSSLIVQWDGMSVDQRKYATAQLIDYYGARYDIPDRQRLQMYRTVECETAHTFETNLKSYIPDEESYGLSQINVPAHPDVSKAQAKDPDFAIDFMAKHFSVGDTRIWTCWRNLFGVGSKK